MSEVEHLTDREMLLGLDGELGTARLAVVERHLASCTTCRSRRTAIEDAGAAIAAMYRHESAAATNDFRARAQMRAKLEVLTANAPRSWVSADVRGAWRRLAGAAVVGMAATITWAIVPVKQMLPLTPGNGPLPVASATPGATWEVSATELCSGTRHTRPITVTMRQQVLNAYGMAGVPADQYELDYLITPELGGATDARNLWPQRYASPVWNARVKDELERLLPQLVCEGQLDLETAQREMAVDWVAAYKKYFNTDEPLLAHRGPPLDDDDEDVVMLADARQPPPIRLVSLTTVR